ACICAQRVYLAIQAAPGITECLVRGCACATETDSFHGAGVVCCVSHSNGDQYCRHSGYSAGRGASDYVGDSIPCYLLDSVGCDHSGVERGEHTLPADSRSCSAEDAWCDAEPDCYGLQHRVCRARAFGGSCRRDFCKSAVACVVAPNGGSVPSGICG